LKHMPTMYRRGISWFAPVRGRGLKPVTEDHGTANRSFAPVRGRGLKPSPDAQRLLGLRFAPVRGRGLKPGRAKGDDAPSVCSPPYGGAD